VLFTDLVGFTEFNDVAGDVRAVEVIDAQLQLASQIVADNHGARIVKEIGDGLMLWFTTADTALQAAVDFMALVTDARAAEEFPLAIRMGLHHGEAVERGTDLVGQTINVGARVAELAGPGELLASDNAVGALERPVPQSPFAFESVGPVFVRGVREPVWLQRVTPVGAARA
jgi:class 3 adenylate cyclase